MSGSAPPIDGRKRRSRSAFETTETLDKLIAAAAIMGFKLSPRPQKRPPRPESRRCCRRRPQKEVLADVADRGAREFDRGDQVRERILHEDDVRTRQGHVGPGADGGADVGGGERRGVVHAVTHHEDALTLTLETVDVLRLFLREDACDHVVGPDVAPDGFGRALFVACQNRHAQAHALQGRDRVLGVGLHGVGDADGAQKRPGRAFTACLAHVEDRFAAVLKGFDLKVLGVGAAVGRPAGVPGEVGLRTDPGGNPAPGRLAEVLDGKRRHVLGRGFGRDGVGERVFGLAFERRRAS